MSYPTRSCVVIEPAVLFMEQSITQNINNDQQRVAYGLLFEEPSYREIPTLTINHNCTVKIDDLFFKKVTTLVPLYWTTKLYAMFLCELTL